MIADIRTIEELWAALDETGASARYSLLLNSATIESLEPFFQVAAAVRARTELVSPLIADPNWRITLVGTALAVLIRAKPLAVPMIQRLVDGSWVAPQLAAGIASLPQDESNLEPLRRLLAESTAESDPKTVLSAHSALSLLNDPVARQFDGGAVFAELWNRDTARCHQIAMRWSGKWQIAGPYFRLRFGVLDAAEQPPAV